MLCKGSFCYFNLVHHVLWWIGADNDFHLIALKHKETG